MTLPSSGPISLLDIQNEFGGSNPIGLDEYYRGGALVPAGTAAGTGSSQTAPLTPAAPVQIATSGTIQLSMFRGTSAVVPFVLNVVISSNTEDFNMRSYALANGWDGTSPLIMSVTINTGVTVSSSSTSTPAFTTKTSGDPAFPVGSSLTLLNNGIIAGRGGAGGTGANVVNVTTFTNGGAGGAGGPALQALDAISITLNGVIGGGGGGGGGGGATVTSTGGKASIDTGLSGGGGGGGRSVLSGGNGGAPGTVAGSGDGIEAAVLGTAGASGTVTAPGAGGVGPSLAGSGATSAGSGGLGGDLGQPGGAGRTLTGSVGGAGGAAGAAVIGNSNITWAFGSSAGIYGSGWTSPYSLLASLPTVNEGSSVTVTLSGSGISGSEVNYLVSGVTSADIDGTSLSGSFTIGSSMSRVFNITADGITEGAETLTLTLTTPYLPYGPSQPTVSVNINDTSIGAGQVLPSASATWEIEDVTLYPTVANAGIGFMDGGSTTYNGSPFNPADWFSVITPGIGASYWVRFTVTSGFTPSGSTINTWISIATSPSWYLLSGSSPSGSLRICEFTVEFATDSSGTNIVATHTNNLLTASMEI